MIARPAGFFSLWLRDCGFEGGDGLTYWPGNKLYDGIVSNDVSPCSWVISRNLRVAGFVRLCSVRRCIGQSVVPVQRLCIQFVTFA